MLACSADLPLPFKLLNFRPRHHGRARPEPAPSATCVVRSRPICDRVASARVSCI